MTSAPRGPLVLADRVSGVLGDSVASFFQDQHRNPLRARGLSGNWHGLTCNELWCAGVHRLHDHPDGAPDVWSLGSMKFSAALTERVQIAMLAQALGEDKSWYRIDLYLYPVIRMDGFIEPPVHGPVGRHLGRRVR